MEDDILILSPIANKSIIIPDIKSEPESPLTNGKTVLMKMCEQNNTNMIQFLLDSNVPYNQSDMFGSTALIYAAKSNNVDAVKVLLTKKHLNTDHRNDDGFSAIMYAAENGNYEMFKHLITITNLSDIKGDLYDIFSVHQDSESHMDCLRLMDLQYSFVVYVNDKIVAICDTKHLAQNIIDRMSSQFLAHETMYGNKCWKDNCEESNTVAIYKSNPNCFFSYDSLEYVLYIEIVEKNKVF